MVNCRVLTLLYCSAAKILRVVCYANCCSHKSAVKRRFASGGAATEQITQHNTLVTLALPPTPHKAHRTVVTRAGWRPLARTHHTNNLTIITSLPSSSSCSPSLPAPQSRHNCITTRGLWHRASLLARLRMDLNQASISSDWGSPLLQITVDILSIPSPGTIYILVTGIHSCS